MRAMSAMADVVFGDRPRGPEMAEALLRRLALDDGMELWVAEADGRDRQRRPARAGARHRVRRRLGRRDAARSGAAAGSTGH